MMCIRTCWSHFGNVLCQPYCHTYAHVHNMYRLGVKPNVHVFLVHILVKEIIGMNRVRICLFVHPHLSARLRRHKSCHMPYKELLSPFALHAHLLT